MSLLAHLIEIIEHEGKMQEECQDCLMALSVAEAERAGEDQEEKHGS